MIPGDLVSDGRTYSQWASQFFSQGQALFAEVPVYPVPGNHEYDSDYFFDYFHLPDNGSAGFEEHWWWHDRGNVRMIGLDSNGTYITQTQLDWLEQVLADTCTDDTIDFVFAQLHHPHQSELWTPGEHPFTGRVIGFLESFSTDCGKPSAHFFGHTHGYSRGVSPEHRHLMVNVATAAGGIDYWGEFPQENYDAYSVSDDSWGFVVFDVQTGDDPAFALTRVSRGDDDTTLDNVTIDTLRVRRFNTSPDRPVAHGPVGEGVQSDCVQLEAGPFADADGDSHQATQWQVSESCTDFAQPVLDQWRQDRDLYHEVDRRAGFALTDEQAQLPGDTALCWRVRYRDDGLAWSEWSEPLAFRTAARARGDNQLLFADAEEGLGAWHAELGTSRTAKGGECSAPYAISGVQSFAVGTCDQAAASLTQEVEVQAGETAHLSALMQGTAARMELSLLDAQGAPVGEALILQGGADWHTTTGELAVPSGALTARVTLSGDGTAAFFDDVSLSFGSAEPATCQGDWPVPEPPEEAQSGCGCDSRSGGTVWLALLLPLALRRRR
jgi:hypothetical protein